MKHGALLIVLRKSGLFNGCTDSDIDRLSTCLKVKRNIKKTVAVLPPFKQLSKHINRTFDRRFAEFYNDLLEITQVTGIWDAEKQDPSGVNRMEDSASNTVKNAP
ncbi:MAG: hypothetical protein LBU25_09735 [Treponema sp.]|nr:hypothetical protein [Treponema sp.]